MNKKQISDFTLNFQESKSIKCKAPCTLYSVLLDNKLIEDPFYGENEQKYIDLARHDCQFEATFDLDESLLNEERVMICFGGLDTICAIYLNGKQIGNTDNMHRSWQFDIKKIARLKANKLVLEFKSALNYAIEQNNKFELWAPDCSLEGYGQMRKTYCSFGWDWGPVIADMGIYREVYIEGNSTAKINSVKVDQIHIDGKVTLDISLDVERASSEEVNIEITCPNGEIINRQGSLDEVTSIEIESPQIWWPNGYGLQPLYNINTSLLSCGKVVSSKSTRIGLRTLTVSTERDKWGREFCFKVNGIKIFSKGANYIPMDAFLTRTNEKNTRKLLQDCVTANFNTVRVWGGGYYPDDYFYDICDELGLVIWQDFMFACSSTYLYDEFQQTVRQEAIEFVTRIRNHACIGLLCGNNEVEQAWCYWNFPEHVRKKMDYVELFEKMLPSICNEYARDIFYWPSSPSSIGSFVKPDDENRGDAHCWTIWHGGESFEKYREKYFRFCSEYGYEAFPSIKTLRTIASESDLNPFSSVMDSHQKCKGGNAKIVGKTADYFNYVYTTEDFIYLSQLMQAEAIKYGAEHWRRNRGRCMGSIYWQLNDNWQTASWSSIDYFGRWKALHYFAKRFYAPVLLSACDEGSAVTLNISNETLSAFVGSVEWSIVDNSFNSVANGKVDVAVDRLSAKDIVNLDLSKYIIGNERKLAFTYKLVCNGQIISSDMLLFCKPKQFGFTQPKIDIEFSESNETCELRIKSDSLVKNLELDFANADCVLSDNYFSLIDGNVKLITIDKPKLSIVELKEQLILRCVNYTNK